MSAESQNLQLSKALRKVIKEAIDLINKTVAVRLGVINLMVRMITGI